MENRNNNQNNVDLQNFNNQQKFLMIKGIIKTMKIIIM